jgi:hypothetical protein
MAFRSTEASDLCGTLADNNLSLVSLSRLRGQPLVVFEALMPGISLSAIEKACLIGHL